MDATAIVPAARSTLAPLGNGAALTRDQIELLKRTVARGVTDDELSLFVHVANRSGLDPFAKQIHAVKRFDRKANRDVMTIQTGIDGFRVVASRTSLHAGTDEAVFVEEDGKPTKATVTVYKIVAGVRCPFTATARWSEYVQTFKDGNPMGLWGKMPFTMLAKCAEALALRKAFPMDLSGVYAHEEMTQAGGPQTFDEPTPPAEADSSPAEAPPVDRDGPPPSPNGAAPQAPAGPSPLTWGEVKRNVLWFLENTDTKAQAKADLRAACDRLKISRPSVKDITPGEWMSLNGVLPEPLRLVL